MNEEYQVKIPIKGLMEAGHRKKAHQKEVAGEAVMDGTLEEEKQQHHHQSNFTVDSVVADPFASTALDLFFIVAEGVTQLITVKIYHVRVHHFDMIGKMALSASRNLSLVFDSKKLPSEA